jgi:aminoglycoside 6'-N-acetyltransferase I
MVRVELKLSDAEDAHVIKNLWPLYLHDVSEFDASKSNHHGIIGEDDIVSTLAIQGERQSAWWTKPESLFPYLILVDGRPAGFNLIAARSGLPDEIDADYVVHEFFVLHAYRGKGVAERGAINGFNAHRGKWEIVTYPNHVRAIAFWRRVVSNHKPDGYTENEVDHFWGRKVAFRFDNAR